tara:strand:- start:1528 stop:1989 length:462 start_codon:yes stop_codon:yes gene_type:complete
MTNIISLNKKQILEYQQNKPPYLMIDEALEIIPGKSAKGFKQLEDDEWFFKVHWENDPNMPGMLQVEALVQMSALAILTMPDNKGKVMYLTSANNLKFSKKIIPGMRLDIETNIKSFKRGIAICDGLGLINNEIACKADFNLILPSELKKYKV